MAQENAPNKPVHLVYTFGGLLVFTLLKWTAEWLGEYLPASLQPSEFWTTTGSFLITLVLGVYLYRNERTYNLVDEVTTELKKVTWPTGKEVKSATIVVFVMAVISATILGIFDYTWLKLTGVVYGG